jgi:hypothetical protein
MAGAFKAVVSALKAEGRTALCSTPCSLAALPAELPACVPDPTVLSGQGCPFWLAPWDSTGVALKMLRAARAIVMGTLFMTFVPD